VLDGSPILSAGRGLERRLQTKPNAFSTHQFPDERKNIILIRDFLCFIQHRLFTANTVEAKLDRVEFESRTFSFWPEHLAVVLSLKTDTPPSSSANPTVLNV